MSKPKGLFITIEGPNGAGKSTILGHVVSTLREIGLNVLETKEPTSSPLGQLIRQLEEDYQGRVYACLIAADRYFHIENEILPAIYDGRVVVSARYVESSLVLQRLDGVAQDFIWALNSQIYRPDLSIVLTASKETLDERLAKRTSLSRFERAKLAETELNYYKDAAEFLAKQGFNVLVLDNDDSPPEVISNRIIREINLLRGI